MPRPEGRAAILEPSSADAAALAALMRETFLAAYGAAAPPADVAAHVARHFTPDTAAREIDDPALQCFVAAVQGRWMGYASLAFGAAPPAGVRGDAVLLRRFYLRSESHGSGLADALLEHALHAARRRGAGAAWLSVWQEAARARRFYERHGFRVVAPTTFRLGSVEQSDWLMVRPAAAAHGPPVVAR